MRVRLVVVLTPIISRLALGGGMGSQSRRWARQNAVAVPHLNWPFRQVARRAYLTDSSSRWDGKELPG